MTTPRRRHAAVEDLALAAAIPERDDNPATGPLFNGGYILATMTNTIPRSSTGVPRRWVRIDGPATGPFYPATLFRNWGTSSEPVAAYHVTLVNGRLSARVWRGPLPSPMRMRPRRPILRARLLRTY